MTSPTFAELGVPHNVATALERDGITTAFPIQVGTIPPALDGRDLCGRAPTGSGKTLAFSIPTAVRVSKAKPGRPTALILTPTRELANQVMQTIKPLARAKKRFAASFYGGTSIQRDLQALRRGVDIAVATPGRLADLVQRGDLSLADCRIVVLDEADRMADMGFLPEVKRLLDRTPDDRQTLLFSATLDGDVDVLIRRYQNNPVRHEVETPEDERGDVRHLFWGVDRTDRRQLTRQILHRVEPAIVFTRTKHGADRLAKQLKADGVSTAAIHGNRSQNQRERALAQFARGEVTALIATDVAARGIHIDGVEVVVHYDLPGSEKDYVHRSGRTGRAGASGVVVTLVPHDQHKDLDALQRALTQELEGLGRGLHDLDLDHLHTDAEAPAPRPTTHAGGGQRQRTTAGNGNGQRTRGGGNRQRSHGGNGQRTNGGSGQRTNGNGSSQRTRSESGGNGDGNGQRTRSESGGPRGNGGNGGNGQSARAPRKRARRR